jgi:glycerol-3-phosphate acyltransferase PlsY
MFSHVNGVMVYVLAPLAGYLTGSFPTAYLVVKRLTGQDIRKIGSGNVGATNVKRVCGTKPFIFVMVIDMLKGALPVLLSKLLFPHLYLLHVLVAVTTVIGHSKSIFLGFAGGKSAATGLGNMVGLAPVPALVLGLIAFLLTRLSRIVSVGSITASILAGPIIYFFNEPLEYIIYGSIAGGYIIFLHKANIQRLLKGTENRI